MNVFEKVKEWTGAITLEHLRIVLWTVLGSSVLISLLTSVAMMNTTLRKIESYNQRTELAHAHELDYQRKILLAHAEGSKTPSLKGRLGGPHPGTPKKTSGSKSDPNKKKTNDTAKDSKVDTSKTSSTLPVEPSSKSSSSSTSFIPSVSLPWWSSATSSSQPASSTQSSDSDIYTPPPGEIKEKRLPKVIIVGVSKCGTRALLDYLDLHPNIVAASKEVNFFTNVTQYNKGPEFYRNTMPLSYSDQLTLEKSPDYFECQMCPERIIAVVRYVKLLLIVCNPVDRLVSQYMQLKEKNDKLAIPMPSFEEWAVEPATSTVRKTVPSIRTGMYSQFIANWFRFFPHERMHVIDGAMFIKDPVGEMKKVETFLEIKPYLTSTDIYYNATKGFHCMYSRMLKKSHCLGPTKGRKHISVVPSVYQTLANYYSPHNDKLKTQYHYFMSWA